MNHYKIPVVYRTRNGPQRGFAVTPEARAFKQAVAILAQGRSLAPQGRAARDRVRYSVSVRVVLGKNDRLDADNVGKVLLDGLVDAGVIHSDARVKIWHVEMVDEDRANPRTEIAVEVIQPPTPRTERRPTRRNEPGDTLQRGPH